MSPAKELSILIVDDDYMVALIHRRMIDALDGFVAVGEAHTGAKAVDEAIALNPDIILLDIYLPDMSGIEVLARIRAAGLLETDVIVVSAAADTDTVASALRSGAVHYIVKPFGAADLRDRLAKIAATRDRLRRHRNVGTPLAQEDIDQVFQVGHGPESTRLPKGLSPETMELVTDTLRQQSDGASAAELGDLCGLARVSIRRYLERLVAIKRAEVTLKYGRAGRPERRYRWIDE